MIQFLSVFTVLIMGVIMVFQVRINHLHDEIHKNTQKQLEELYINIQQNAINADRSLDQISHMFYDHEDQLQLIRFKMGLPYHERKE